MNTFVISIVLTYYFFTFFYIIEKTIVLVFERFLNRGYRIKTQTCKQEYASARHIELCRGFKKRDYNRFKGFNSYINKSKQAGAELCQA